jgi:hypothetical protein
MGNSEPSSPKIPIIDEVTPDKIPASMFGRRVAFWLIVVIVVGVIGVIFAGFGETPVPPPSDTPSPTATPIPPNTPSELTVDTSPPPTKTQPPTDTPTATPTQTPTAMPPLTSAATPIPPASPIPISSEICENNSYEFVRDIGVQDEDVFFPGEEFDKIWQIKNSGDCSWESGFTISYWLGDYFGTQREHDLRDISIHPNETLDVTVPMKAPTSPGRYTGKWVIRDPSGNLLRGKELTVVIQVK